MNLKTDLMEELFERISVSEGGKPKKLSKQRALLKSLVAKAITKGDARAANILINLIVRVLEVSRKQETEILSAMTISQFSRTLSPARSLGRRNALGPNHEHEEGPPPAGGPRSEVSAHGFGCRQAE